MKGAIPPLPNMPAWRAHGQPSCRLSVPLGKYRELTISWVIQEHCYNAYIAMRHIRLEENHGEYRRIREKKIKV
jgi:hypothetical protein